MRIQRGLTWVAETPSFGQKYSIFMGILEKMLENVTYCGPFLNEPPFQKSWIQPWAKTLEWVLNLCSYKTLSLCPQLGRSWRGILVSGCASVRLSRTVHARVLKFHIWISNLKIVDYVFFLIRVISLFGVMPLLNIRMKADPYHILWTVHARVLKFHIWIPDGKIADTFFFLSELSPFLELCPFEKIRMKSCQQDISKSIWVRGETWSADRGWRVDYLIKLKKTFILFLRSYGPSTIWAF